MVNKLKTPEERAKHKEERKCSDVRAIGKTPEGRRLFWDLLEVCEIFQNDFIESTSLTQFQKGRKYVGSWLLRRLLAAKSSLYSQIIEEHASEIKREEIEIEMEEEQSDPLSL